MHMKKSRIFINANQLCANGMLHSHLRCFPFASYLFPIDQALPLASLRLPLLPGFANHWFLNLSHKRSFYFCAATNFNFNS